MKGLKTTAGEDGAQLPESNGTFVSTARPDHHQKARRKHDVTLVAMRVACVLSSVAAVCLMVTAKERSTMSIFGFSLPIYSNWSYSDSFE
ncbi:hypothetical protein RHGRI_035322 [Rhododendron griersonianum]|uniref:CASP-like protein n=1 Tax=Rhododendron griersonianum TaxID=479676 RepID=A0AAV6I6T1_9ERIC|nr:hypothetical protein RHGRI_035322 [Rhododendron griersonianum]